MLLAHHTSDVSAHQLQRAKGSGVAALGEGRGGGANSLRGNS
jgi:hypothetical protein